MSATEQMSDPFHNKVYLLCSTMRKKCTHSRKSFLLSLDIGRRRTHMKLQKKQINLLMKVKKRWQFDNPFRTMMTRSKDASFQFGRERVSIDSSNSSPTYLYTLYHLRNQQTRRTKRRKNGTHVYTLKNPASMHTFNSIWFRERVTRPSLPHLVVQ